VLDRAGRPLAAISVSGPISRILHEETPDLAGLLREHAEAVGAALGQAA
jgi:DNA-binding IclR family transcriptional regulator